MLQIEFTTMDKYFEETNDGCVVMLDYITAQANNIYKIGSLLENKLVVGAFSHPESDAYWLVLRDKLGNHFEYHLHPENIIADECGIETNYNPYIIKYGEYKICTKESLGQLVVRALNVPAHPDFMDFEESQAKYGWASEPIQISFTCKEIIAFREFLSNLSESSLIKTYTKDRCTFDLTNYTDHSRDVLLKVLDFISRRNAWLFAV